VLTVITLLNVINQGRRFDRVRSRSWRDAAQLTAMRHDVETEQRYRRSQCAACRQLRQIQEKAQDYSGFGLKPQTPTKQLT
jgi:hypothetical protein